MELIHCQRCGELFVHPSAGDTPRCAACLAQERAAAAYELDGLLTCITCGQRKPLAEVTDVGPGYRCDVCMAEREAAPRASSRVTGTPRTNREPVTAASPA